MTADERRWQRREWRRRVVRLPEDGFRRWLLMVGSEERERAAGDGYWLTRDDAARLLGVDSSSIKRYTRRALAEGWLTVVEQGRHRGQHQVYALSVPATQKGGRKGGTETRSGDPLCAPSNNRTTQLQEEHLPTEATDLRAWVTRLARARDVPTYGSPEWFTALAADDPVWLIAALRYAECWRAECDPDRIAERLRDELAASAAADAEAERAGFADMARQVRASADRPTWADIRARWEVAS